MQTYIVRVYRARPEDTESVAGVIEDVESGQKQFYKSLIDLQAMLADSISKGQFELPELESREPAHYESIAMAG